jgi:hypothetical protein
VLFRLGEGEFHMRRKSLVVSKMVVGWKETYDSLRIDPVNMGQAVRDRRRSPVVARLYQQSLTGDTFQLIGVKALVSLRQHQKRLFILDHPGQAPPRLVQQGFSSG